MNRICTGRDGVDEYDTFNKVVRCNNGQWMTVSAGVDRR